MVIFALCSTPFLETKLKQGLHEQNLSRKGIIYVCSSAKECDATKSQQWGFTLAFLNDGQWGMQPDHLQNAPCHVVAPAAASHWH